MVMSVDNQLISENLDKEQKKTLTTVLNLIIPANEDDKMTSANDVGFFSYMENVNIESFIQELLNTIIDESHNNYGQEFFALSSDEQLQLINVLKRKHLRLFNSLTNHVFQCYYQYDNVLEAIGVEAQPPFPNGYFVEEGNIYYWSHYTIKGKSIVTRVHITRLGQALAIYKKVIKYFSGNNYNF